MKQTFRKAFPIDKLEPHPDNPKPHDDVSIIEDSIEQFGFFGAVLVQESRSRIIAGHGSVLAAKAKGLKTVPVMLLDVDDDTAMRILLVDNRSAELGTYDDRQLAHVLSTLAANSDLSGTGWTLDDLDTISRLLDNLDADPLDVAAAWDGLPGYDNEDRRHEFKCVVYFADKNDAPSFFKRIGREMSSRIWWPDEEDPETRPQRNDNVKTVAATPRKKAAAKP